MSANTAHAYFVVFVLLLAAVLHVHCSHRKSSSRPRDNSQGQQYHDGEDLHESNSHKLTHQQHWPHYKHVDPDNDMDYDDEEPVSNFFLENSDKAASSSPVLEKSARSKESLSETNKHKTSAHTEGHNSSHKFQLESNSNRKLRFLNTTKSDKSNNVTSVDSELNGELRVQSKTSRDRSSSNESSVDQSGSVPSKGKVVSVIDSNCDTCRRREMDKNYRIMHFKQQILNTLQIRNLPNVTGVAKPKVPALTHLYDMDGGMISDAPHKKRVGHGSHFQDDVYDDDFIVKTERVFTAAKEAPVAGHLNLTDTVYFPPSVQLFTSKIKTAYLWLYIRKQKDTPASITVERILPESLPEHRVITKPVFSQKLAKEKAFGWKRIDIRDTMRQWVRHPMTNFGLQVKALDKTGNNLIILSPSKPPDKGYEPWLDTKIIEPRSNSRHRRSESLDCEENPTEPRCCRHPLIVGFAEFGWDWIIAPTHVKADYCTGECRLTMQESTPYSWVNQQMPGSSSCCTPIKLSPLPLLYFDESNNIVYQILQNMKVDKCGCA